MAKNVAVGMIRPHSIFFYEVDVKRGKFRITKKSLIRDMNTYFNYWSMYRTKHGYHLLANAGNSKMRKEMFSRFSKYYPSDFTIKLRPRWNRKDPQVLRISEKWDLKTGRITSPAPKFICGNLKLNNLVQGNGIQKYKVMYYAK